MVLVVQRLRRESAIKGPGIETRFQAPKHALSSNKDPGHISLPILDSSRPLSKINIRQLVMRKESLGRKKLVC